MNWRDAENLDEWPSKSPGCNLQHHSKSVDFFQDAVAERKPETVAEFEEVLQEFWCDASKILQEYIRNLYQLMPARLCLKSNLVVDRKSVV